MIFPALLVAAKLGASAKPDHLQEYKQPKCNVYVLFLHIE